jgi:fructose-specific phosphotransferase system IIC component
MTGQMQIVFGILVGAVGLFVCGRPRADVVAIVVVLALMFSQSSSTPAAAAAARCLGCQGLGLDWKTGRGQCGGGLVAREQRVRIIRDLRCHQSTITFASECS